VPVVKVKVVVLMVAGFMATLKLAVTTVFGHAPAAPLGGATAVTVGGIKPRLVALSASLHPVATISNRNTGNQILGLLYLRMTVILLSS
jgi:hypothetical protein